MKKRTIILSGIFMLFLEYLFFFFPLWSHQVGDLIAS
jgi:glycopeptide antibiotics resistance protein